MQTFGFSHRASNFLAFLPVFPARPFLSSLASSGVEEPPTYCLEQGPSTLLGKIASQQVFFFLQPDKNPGSCTEHFSYTKGQLSPPSCQAVFPVVGCVGVLWTQDKSSSSQAKARADPQEPDSFHSQGSKGRQCPWVSSPRPPGPTRPQNPTECFATEQDSGGDPGRG